MQVLITGYSGQLGYDIAKILKKKGYQDILCPNKQELDLTNKDMVEKYIIDNSPNIIFHCAAYTAVDKAENEQDLAYQINVIGTKSIVKSAKCINAKIIYISTDYVFNGQKEGIYEIEDETSPKNFYGLSKLQGEEEVRKYEKHFIVRTSWVFGINGNNFVKTMLKLSDTKSELNIVDDQIGSPTYTPHLASLLIDMAQTEKYGTYHATNEGYCSWAEFAEKIFEINQKQVLVHKVSTEEYLTLTEAKQAYRPKNSKLSKLSLINAGFKLLPTWQEALIEYNKELTDEKILKKGIK